MKNEIEKLNNYFVEKLILNEFTINRADRYTVDVIIDSEYLFSLWHANGADCFECYNKSFMDLTFTEDEKIMLCKKMKGIYDAQMNTPEEVAKRKEHYEKLKAEFEPNI